MHEPFRILFVCMGNTCRSPMAAQLLRAHLGSEPGISVSSAGTLADEGAPLTPEAAAVIDSIVGAVGSHRARQLTPALLVDADLVLTATRAIRAQAVRLAPGAVRYTFTINEFARLLNKVQFALISHQALIASVAQERSMVLDARDDIDDPIGRGAAVYRKVGAEIDRAVRSLAMRLTVGASER